MICLRCKHNIHRHRQAVEAHRLCPFWVISRRVVWRRRVRHSYQAVVRCQVVNGHYAIAWKRVSRAASHGSKFTFEFLLPFSLHWFDEMHFLSIPIFFVVVESSEIPIFQAFKICYATDFPVPNCLCHCEPSLFHGNILSFTNSPFLLFFHHAFQCFGIYILFTSLPFAIFCSCFITNVIRS